MLKIGIYLKCILQYLLGLFIISGVLVYFFPRAGLVVFGLGFIGMFGSVKENVDIQYREALEKREKKREHKRVQKVAMQSKDEFDGFEQAMALTRRNMR